MTKHGREDMKLKILIVDDDEALLNLVENLFTGEGYEVSTQKSGIDAIRYLRSNLPDLIISDLDMPKINGRQLCKTVRQMASTKEIPFIMLSAHNSPHERVESFRSGADDYVPKPFNTEEFILRVNALLIRSGKIKRD